MNYQKNQALPNSSVTDVPGAIKKIADYISRVSTSDNVTIHSVRNLAGGAIQENWLLDLELIQCGRARKTHMVLRTDSPSGVEASMSRAQEYSVLSCAYQAGVKVPEPLWFCADLSLIGRPFFLMEALEGTASGKQLTDDTSFEFARPALCRELGSSLARLHTIHPPQSELEFLPAPAENHAKACIDSYRSYLDTLKTTFLPIEWGLRWCELNLPNALPPSLIHRDYRTGNYMVHEGRLNGILDWEFAAWGDPREDIGWFTARCWRFSRPDREAGGVGDLQDFLDGYNAITPLTLSENDLRFWQVMAHIRWAIIAIQQTERYLSGGEDKLELALTGHIVPQLEQEILILTGEAA